jgi:hypothetical protein
MNLAAIWKLPIVFLVENNQYGMGTEVGRASALTNIYEKGCAYGVENRQYNGQDVIETHDVMLEALAYARQEGPVLLEAITYRYVGHSMATLSAIAPARSIRTAARSALPVEENDREGTATFDEFRAPTRGGNEVDAIVKFPRPRAEDARLGHIVNPIGRVIRRQGRTPAQFGDERCSLGEGIGEGGTHAVTRRMSSASARQHRSPGNRRCGHWRKIAGQARGRAGVINFFLALDQIVNHAAAATCSSSNIRRRW